ncbi:hypothetical protein GF337_04255 [candidate division KSB1 bacterium]|nr:hypothetical protein [candidate division KSB1 bacterium]
MNTELEIIATLGPGVVDKISELISAGTTAFRLNCSHLSLESVSQWLVKIEKAFRKTNTSIPLWLDLQGAKLRIGKLIKPLKLAKGSVVTFVPNYSQLGDEIPLPHKKVFEKIQPYNKISLNDGRIILDVQQTGDETIKAKVLNDGEISSFKGFNIDGYEDHLSEIFSRDLAFIEQTVKYENVGYAVSYIQTAEEVQLVREYSGNRPITSKIERLKTFDGLREIAECSDALWLCRGDLGVEANIYNLFHFEKVFIQRLLLIEKPYLIAGQVLENMVRNPNPSRSEIAHLGYLIENGFKGVVLSDETAIGKHPVKAVEFCHDYFKFLMNL